MYSNFRGHCNVPCKRYRRDTIAVSREYGLNTATVEALYGRSTV